MGQEDSDRQLTEQLARRLWEVHRQHGDSIDGVFLGIEDVRFRRMAAECIRQMEWASAEAYNRTITESIDCSGYPGMHGIRILGKRPLTLAPPDWKP